MLTGVGVGRNEYLFPLPLRHLFGSHVYTTSLQVDSIHFQINVDDLYKMSNPKSQFAKVEGLELIVFDLDYTLWPMYVDTHVDPPFKKDDYGTITDSNGTVIKCYPEVPSILERLHSIGYKLGVASRTHAPKEGRELINIFGWDKFFTYYEIYPGCKTSHFNSFKRNSGLNFNQMMFFDDETRNIRDISLLGVTSVLVNNGVDTKVMENGFRKYLESKENSFAIEH